MRKYTVAVLLTVEANTYEEAEFEAEQAADLIQETKAQVIYDYEHDNTGQRVVYLPTEKGEELDETLHRQ